MNISVVGTGYVGLVSGTCFAESGNNVVCVDINETKVESLKNGKIPIYEPGLETLFNRNVRGGRLSFTTDLKSAVDHGDIIFLALPTPPGEDGSADLSYILGVADDLGDLIKSYKVIVDKSTVPVGTAERVESVLSKKLSSDLYDVVSNPRISFMNEIANLCDLTGANVDSVRLGMGSDGRIGKRFLFPGVGYGGSCFPKDVQALAMTADNHEYDFKILKSVMQVNDKQKLRAFEKLKEVYADDLKNKTIGIWGLAFKPNTDDIREAPALYLIEDLLKAGAKIKAFDPEAMDNVKALFGDKMTFCSSYTEASTDIDVLVIMTEWGIFRNPDFDHLKSSIKDKIIFDGRNLYDPEEMKELGFT